MTGEERRKPALAVYRRLNRLYGPQKCALHYSTPHELLVATILSAQCTDVRVNQVTPALFSRYPDAAAFAAAVPAELEEAIRPVGFFRHKAAAIIGASQEIVTRYHGKVPQTMDELNQLPGIGRKTANVVLGDAFGVPGFPVDTHVNRLLNRIGLTTESDPVKIEAEINAAMPSRYWVNFSHLLIVHGRQVCQARKPQCETCVLKTSCRFAGGKQ